MPGDAPHEVARCPERAAARPGGWDLPARPGRQRSADRLTCPPQLVIQRRPVVLAELLRQTAHIRRVGSEDVPDDPVTVAATAAGAFAQLLPLRRLHRPIERSPDRRQDRLGSLSLGLVERLLVERGRDVRCPEIGRACAGRRSTTAKAAGSSGGTKSIAVREKILA